MVIMYNDPNMIYDDSRNSEFISNLEKSLFIICSEKRWDLLKFFDTPFGGTVIIFDGESIVKYSIECYDNGAIKTIKLRDKLY